MKMIVGLGNPGRKYENTRHNVGFMAVDNYVSSIKETFKLKANFNAFLCVTKDVIFVKPQTYMNKSGESVLKIMKYYNIEPKDILVILDDLSLTTGRVRVRRDGSSGGHNGLKSISELINSQSFPRVRIGIDKNEMIDTKDYVLGKFSKDDQKLIIDAIIHTSLIIEDFINDIDIDKICSTRN